MSRRRSFHVFTRVVAAGWLAGLMLSAGPLWAQEKADRVDPFAADPAAADQPAKDPFGGVPAEDDPFAAGAPAGADPFGAAEVPEKKDKAAKRDRPKEAPKSPQKLKCGQDAIMAALGEPTEIFLIDTPLQDLVDFLKDQHQIQIHIDQHALDDVGIGSDCPICFSMAGVPLRAALELMLGELDLTWTISSGVLLITTPEEAESMHLLVARTYDVSDLLVSVPDYPYRPGLPTTLPPNPPPGPPGMFGQGSAQGMVGGMGGMGGGFFSVDSPLRQQAGAAVQDAGASGGGMGGMGGMPYNADWWPKDTGTASPSDLIDVIETIVEPTTWDSVGGPGSCVFFGRMLVINQTIHVHEEIQNLLDAMRAELRGASTIVMDVRFLLLDSQGLNELKRSDDESNRLAVDSETLDRMTRELPSYRGQLACVGGQKVHIASGDRRTVIKGAIPVVGSGIGYQPVVVIPNVGVLLEICPSIIADSETAMLDVQSTITGWRDPELPLRVGSGYPASQKVEPGSGEIINEPGGESSVSVDRVTMPTHQLATTLRVPLDKPVLVGGLTLAPNGGAEPKSDEKGEQKQLYLFVETSVLRHK